MRLSDELKAKNPKLSTTMPRKLFRRSTTTLLDQSECRRRCVYTVGTCLQFAYIEIVKVEVDVNGILRTLRLRHVLPNKLEQSQPGTHRETDCQVDRRHRAKYKFKVIYSSLRMESATEILRDVAVVYI